jgi:nucleotide-binding universal stress UspA family protein
MTQLATSLLLATDCSAEARRAQEVAIFLARACGAELVILSVLEAPPGMDTQYQVNQVYLEQLGKDVRKQTDLLVREAEAQGLSVKAEIVTGMPSQQINEAARARKSDLVVMGTRGRTGLAHVLLGSTAEGVVRGAPCPVLTVRSAPDRGQPAPAIRLTHILVPVDFSDCSIEALEYAVQAAKVFAASVTILHVIEPASYGLDFTLSHADDAQKARAAIEKRLAELAVLFKGQGISAQYRLQGGAPGGAITDTAHAVNADLIVMGTHGRRGFSHLVSGSIAEAVLRRAPCPVLTVKSPKFGPGYQRVMPETARREKG